MTAATAALLEKLPELLERLGTLCDRMEAEGSPRVSADAVLTVKQAADELNCGEQHVRDLVTRKVLPCLPRRVRPGSARGKRGSPIRILRDDLQKHKGVGSRF